MFAKSYIIGIVAGTGFFFIDKNERTQMLKSLQLFKVLLLVIAIITVISGGIGSHATNLIFDTNYSLAFTILITILFSAFLKEKQTLSMLDYISLLLLAVLTTQGKYIGVSFLVVMIYIFFNIIYPKTHKSRKFFILLAAAIVLSLGYDLVFDDLQQYYLSDNDNMARRMMLLKLPHALDGYYGILGRGFASYCVPSLSIHYSSFMDESGLSYVFGLSENNLRFINDGYYWSFIGEMGCVGVFLYIIYFIFILKPFYILYKQNTTNYNILALSAMMMSVILVFSFGSGFFFGSGPYIMLILGMLRCDAVQLIKNPIIKN
jgi:predicted membrane protein